MTQDPREKVYNGCFNDGDAGWFSANAQMSTVDGKLRVEVPGGTGQPFDVIVGQNDVLLRRGASYTLAFTASANRPVRVKAQVQLSHPPFTAALSHDVALDTEQRHTFTFTSNLDTDRGQVAFQLGGNRDGWFFFADDVSLVGGDPVPPYVPDTGPRVRVNQLGYLPFGPKRATIVTDAPEPIPWRVNNSDGCSVASGTSTLHGVDESSGQRVHTVDFGGFTDVGSGYTLSADEQTSYPFEISASLYDKLRFDALHFFYIQRSGIPIDDALAPGYARVAGHVGVPPNKGDTDVPCQPGVGDYRLDVRGGWYDAGDHGKYVVNGGITTYQLLSQFERTKTAAVVASDALGDGSLRIPERGNAVPDILDEARWELEFLLRMQVPAGKPRAGMAHHKVHDQVWTGLPLYPHEDDKLRELHPPSTAATLNLAAVAAHAARLYPPFDPAFARHCLDAATTAWKAAHTNPEIHARPEDTIGGGPYDDGEVNDERYWAAAELFITTGEQTYLDVLRASPHWAGDVFGPHGFSWQSVAALGRLDLATVPSQLPAADREAARASVRSAADDYLRTARGQAYGMPLSPDEYNWGSNSTVLNKLVVIATAFDLTGDQKYRDGVLEGLDYIFGRNALNQSYVTGYGEHHSHNQHSRLFGRQADPTFPPPPAGSLAGGPNTGLQDPKAKRLLLDHTAKPAKPPKQQFCYIDDIESYSTNEVAINWNSALSWVISFTADQRDGGDGLRRRY